MPSTPLDDFPPDAYVARLLVVDDNPQELKLLLEALRGARFEISVAFEGMQGYGRAVAQLPDLILMDVRMGKTDGFTAARLLKADARTAHIPLIFLTGSGSLDDRLTGLTEGAIDYILKPFEPVEVLARVRAHLRPALGRATASFSLQDTREALEGSDHVLFEAAVREVDAHLARTPNVAEIARRVGTHEKRLTRVFRDETGMSVFEFVRGRRIALAKRLLSQTPLGIGDIAAESGFSSAANLAAAFRSATGVSPSEYRQPHVQVRPVPS